MTKAMHLCSYGEQCPMFKTWHNVMNRRVRVYDNRQTIDRYEVQIMHTVDGAKTWHIYSMSDRPLSPQGVNQYAYSSPKPQGHGRVVGFRVKPQDLPREVISAIEARL